MDLVLNFLISLSLCPILASSATFKEFVYPNFTASNLGYVDSSGTFLYSSNETYKAAMFNPGAQQARFYLCIIHVGSNTITWSANRDLPVSKSGFLSLTNKGLSVFEDEGTGLLKWSTPSLQTLVYALQLTENGNLVLLDHSNTSLWESFNNPSDTIVIGQIISLKTVLKSLVSSDDLSSGDYELVLTESDAVLQWKGLAYWKVSMDTKAYVNSKDVVNYMFVNQTGFFLTGQNRSSLIIRVDLPFSEFRTAKIDYTGQFVVTSFLGASSSKQEFLGPIDKCSIPYTCGKLGLCNSGVSLNGPTCSCPTDFSSNGTNSCVPSDSSYTLPVPCDNSTNNSIKVNTSSLSYLKLGYGLDYFANNFNQPTSYEVNESLCEDLCSQDCTCVGFFYQNSSGSCFILQNVLGTFILTPTSNDNGFIKTVIKTPTIDQGSVNNASDGNLPRSVVVLLPIGVVLFVFAIAILLWRRFIVSDKSTRSRNSNNSQSSGDLELYSIMGLPSRFEYEELRLATEDFKTKIGTGGFGTVYKGILRDKTLVAVKRITNLGVRAKKDFWTEVAIIGNIHHVNLVKLKGYCAQRRQWLLVYEYMNRGSLDKTLFGNNRPVLEWQERVDIALGSARGLAYLHNGCEKRIVHCDVKPENILLHDHFHAKISDFGLSKLLNREQSGLVTTMRGTRGYLAPEWLTSSAVTDKTDIYSFGMVLLELVSGRRNCASHTRSQSLDHEQHRTDSNNIHDNSPSSDTDYFPLYTLEMHKKGTYLELVDPRLKDRVTNEEVGRLIHVALCCIHEEPGLRPTMANVVGMLEGEAVLGIPRIESLNYLRFYGRRFAEASVIEGSGNRLHEVVVYRDGMMNHRTCDHSTNGNKSNNNNNNDDNDVHFSYVESQQVSGPR